MDGLFKTPYISQEVCADSLNVFSAFLLCKGNHKIIYRSLDSEYWTRVVIFRLHVQDTQTIYKPYNCKMMFVSLRPDFFVLLCFSLEAGCLWSGSLDFKIIPPLLFTSVFPLLPFISSVFHQTQHIKVRHLLILCSCHTLKSHPV